MDIIKPGVGMDISSIAIDESLDIKRQSISDLLIQIVPQNIFKSMANNEFLSVIFFAIIVGVITSYSIHYTKLYDNNNIFFGYKF